MAVADRTISFRASEEFLERLERARKTVHELRGPHEPAEIDAWLIGEFNIALMRRLSPLTDAATQGAFVRAVMEALVGATERVQRELGRLAAYGEFATQDEAGDDLRRAALAAAAEHWQ